MKRVLLFGLLTMALALYARAEEPASNLMNITVPDDFRTIAEAYAHVKDGGTITIKPGKHGLAETLVIDRNVTFLGDTSNPEEVIIDCPFSDAIEIRSGSPTFQNITVGSSASAKPQEVFGGFYITGGTPKFTSCVFSSQYGVGMIVHGKEADPTVKNCIAKDCGNTGLLIQKEGRGSFTKCEVYGNKGPGISVSQFADPTFIECKIHDGKSNGVTVVKNGRGEFRDCEVYENAIRPSPAARSTTEKTAACGPFRKASASSATAIFTETRSRKSV